MNLMSNARLFQDDGKTKNDLMFDMLPQVKFNMMGQIQIQQELKKPNSSSSPYSTPSPASSSSAPSSPNVSGTGCLGLDRSKLKEDPESIVHFESSSAHHSDQSDLPLSLEEEIHPSRDRNSPLDFSRKKLKFEKSEGNRKVPKKRHGGQDNSSDEPDSPCSRLRNILRMKTPLSPVFSDNLEGGTVLNLSKDVSHSLEWDAGRDARPSASDNRSSSSSPTGMDMHSYLTSSKHLPGTGSHPFSFPTSMAQSLGLSPYAILSQGMAQHAAGAVAPRPFESPNGTIFSHSGISVSTGSPNFGSIPPPMSQAKSPGHLVPNCGNAGKPRMTRPFKAYPKDPLTFPTVGLYGLPVVGPTPGATEALIHQQSNQAYAEFRKQMLNQSNNSRTKRMSHPKSFQQEPLSDSTTSSTNPMDYGLSSGMVGSEVVGSGSGGEDCLSTSDDGFSVGIQSQATKGGRGKSDEQLKDEAYWERRRKNNEAAKRSRDARRAKEDEIAIRAAFLEQENLKLRFEVCALKNETAKLRCLLYKAQ